MADEALLDGLLTGQERTFHQDPLFAFRLLADIGLRAISGAVNDPATAVQVLDTIQGILSPLVARDLHVADIADGSGAVRVILALPSWDDYLRTSLDDLIESATRSPMVLLRARTLLITLLKTAPAQRRPSLSWRLKHTEDLLTANFPAIWRDANGQGRYAGGGKLSTAKAPSQDGLRGRWLVRHQARAVPRADANFYAREVFARRCSARVCCLSQAIRRAIERAPPACARPAAAATTSATMITRSWVRRSHAMRAAARTTIAARIAFCRPLASGDLRAEPVGPDEVTVFQAGPRRTAL